MFREDLKGLPTGKIAPTARGNLAVNSPSEERGRARAEEASDPLINGGSHESSRVHQT